MNMNKKSLIYLASPHSHQSSSIREDRYKEALRCTTWMVSNGLWVYSPIVNNHHIGVSLLDNKLWHEQSSGWEYWNEFDTELITRCDEMYVLMIPGTSESVGVRAEIEIAKIQGKKISAIWEIDHYDKYVVGGMIDYILESYVKTI